MARVKHEPDVGSEQAAGDAGSLAPLARQIFTVRTPATLFTGPRGNVMFRDGVGTTDDPRQAQMFQVWGYQVDPDPSKPKAPLPAKPE